MSVRRGDNQGQGGAPSDGDDDGRPDAGDIDPEAIPVAKALTPMRRERLLLAESGVISDRLPVGMATEEQFDAFRQLRTTLLSMAAAVGRTHFTTLVVPVTSGSGASFVARNLAAVFTLQDKRVAILVDCNLRHPTQHLALGVPAEERGLFDYLEKPRAGLDRLLRPTDIAGLHLIPAGVRSSIPREYFSSQPMRVVMAALQQAPCYVFLDGPPTQGSPDARILSDLVDFVILVAGYGLATTEEIAAAAALFEPTKFAGVVFNERS